MVVKIWFIDMQKKKKMVLKNSIHQYYAKWDMNNQSFIQS